jgi:hypothetical protein
VGGARGIVAPVPPHLLAVDALVVMASDRYLDEADLERMDREGVRLLAYDSREDEHCKKYCTRSEKETILMPFWSWRKILNADDFVRSQYRVEHK